MEGNFKSGYIKERLDYYNSNYRIIVDYPLVNEKPIIIKDYSSPDERICRFCGNAKPEATFKKKAHAIPELLGNKAIILSNECDTCNEFFAYECEDHLAKWFGPMRTLSKMNGKRGIPKYKSDEFTAAKGENGMELFINSDSSEMNFTECSSGTFKIPVDMKTQPYIPIRAAKALVKSAISILPESILPECDVTIQWLLGKSNLKMHKFPVLYAFTPGYNPYIGGKVVICKRKEPDAKLPLLWYIVASANFLFQIMIPFCNSDKWIKESEDNNFQVTFFPTPFSDEYTKKFGKTTWYCDDWAGETPVVQNRSASFHFDKIEEKKPSSA